MTKKYLQELECLLTCIKKETNRADSSDYQGDRARKTEKPVSAIVPFLVIFPRHIKDLWHKSRFRWLRASGCDISPYILNFLRVSSYSNPMKSMFVSSPETLTTRCWNR